MNLQKEVSSFIEKHELDGTTEYRILDLVAEVGEIAGDAAKSADYGINPKELNVKEDEIGDALFSLLAVAESLDIDAEKALQKSLDKYEKRIKETGDAGSS